MLRALRVLNGAINCISGILSSQPNCVPLGPDGSGLDYVVGVLCGVVWGLVFCRCGVGVGVVEVRYESGGWCCGDIV